jgi:uncharacterized protein YbjT (DUF2867 family)
MRVAITGGTGFVGSYSAAAFRARGDDPVLLSRRTGTPVTDVAALEAAFAGCETVVHAAGINRERKDQTYDAVHVRGAENVLAAARGAGVRRVILVSFLRARPGTGSPYHESKWRAEELVRTATDLDTVILKPGVTYGRGDHLLDHLSHAFHTFPVFGLVGFRPRAVRPLAGEDLARVIVAATDDPRLVGGTFSVLGPETLTLEEVVRRIAAATGKRPWFVPMPVFFHRGLAWFCEMTMRTPLLARAQLRILLEGVAEATGGPVESLPEDLLPTRPLDRGQITRGLPAPRRFGRADLICSGE